MSGLEKSVMPRLDPLVSGTFFAFMMSEREFFPC
jgi:hypothetical protein